MLLDNPARIVTFEVSMCYQWCDRCERVVEYREKRETCPRCFTLWPRLDNTGTWGVAGVDRDAGTLVATDYRPGLVPEQKETKMRCNLCNGLGGIEGARCGRCAGTMTARSVPIGRASDLGGTISPAAKQAVKAILGTDERAAALTEKLDRATRKVHNQRRELKRLNRKLVVVEAQSRLDQYRRGEADANPFQSRAELRHEFNKMLRRAQAAEAEVERLRMREVKLP